MRISIFFLLLIACFCMAVLSQIGDELLSHDLKCSAGNVSEFSVEWDLYSLTLKDVQCATSYLGNIIYHFGVTFCQYFVYFVHVLQSSLIMQIIFTLYDIIVVVLVCDIVYTTCIKPRLLPSEERRNSLRQFVEQRTESDSESGEAHSSNTSSIISIGMLFHESFSNSNASLSNSGPCHDAGILDIEDLGLLLEKNKLCFCKNAWKADNCKQEQSLVSKRRQRSFSGFLAETRSSESSLEGLAGVASFVRQRRSWPSMTKIDRRSQGSSLLDALNISYLNLSRTQSNMALSPLLSSSSGSFKSIYSSKSSIPQLSLPPSTHQPLALPPSSHHQLALSPSTVNSALSGSSVNSPLSRSLDSIAHPYNSNGRLALSNSPINSALSRSSDSIAHSHNSDGRLALSRSPINSALSRSSHSMALSHHSAHTVWTMYKYPVPGSITSSDPHQYQLQRSEREYIFIQRPFITPLPVVCNWLRDNFFGSQASRVSHVIQGGQTSQDHRGTQDSRVAQGNRVTEGSHNSQGRLVSRDGSHSYKYNQSGDSSNVTRSGPSSRDPQPSYSWINYPNQSIQANRSSQRDTAYLINNNRTEVILCGIPGPTDTMIPSRTWGSMTELHNNRKWQPEVYTSLPNICEDFGLKNRVAFNVQNLESFVSRESDSVEERNYICDDNFDSISVVCEKVEQRDQMLRDAARAKIEQKRERQRRLRLFRENEELESTRPVQVTPSSFFDVLKRETYEQVFVPLLLHAGREILLSLLT